MVVLKRGKTIPNDPPRLFSGDGLINIKSEHLSCHPLESDLLLGDHMIRMFAIAMALGLSGIDFARADITYSTPGSSYGNTFDSLAISGTGNAWSNDVTYLGWNLFNSTGAAITAYNAGNGSSSTGSFYSFGSTGSQERALGGVGSGGAYFGSPASGAVAGHIAVQFTNATGITLDTINIAYDGEQWRDGGNATPSAQTMVLEYGFGPTFGSVGIWNAPGGNFDWSSPVFTTTGAAVDGNAAGLVAGRGGTINNLAWANGQSLWIRWIERNDSGNDHGLAIDRFFFSANSSIPEPASVALIVCGLGGLLTLTRRRAR